MQKRRLGQTDLEVSVIGVGGMQLAMMTFQQASELLNRALDLGINLIETAAVYEDSEEKIGQAIAARRDEYILTTKTYHQTREEAWQDIEHSLACLDTDYIDLYQVSYVQGIEALDRVLGPDGAYMALVEAKEKGVIGHIGISSHRSPILVAAVRTSKFAAVQVPFNIMEGHATEELLSVAREHDVGVIVMKALAAGVLNHPAAGIKYVLSHDVATSVVGMQNLAQLEENVAIGKSLTPLSEEEEALLDAERERLGPDFCERYGACQACPEGIRPIEAMFWALGLMHKVGIENLDAHVHETVRALNLTKCTFCGWCEEVCPNNMPIQAAIREAIAAFGLQ
jgi:predicted aldo/keto reductase-like oxidoreductase